MSDDDRPVYDPATKTGDSSASGNRGANNPGEQQIDADSTIGVKADTGLARGVRVAPNVGTGTGTAMDAGGIGNTGLSEMTPADEEQAEDVLANAGTPGVNNSPEAIAPTETGRSPGTSLESPLAGAGAGLGASAGASLPANQNRA
jgi:hypothetical protein